MTGWPSSSAPSTQADTDAAFDTLVAGAQACVTCPTMHGRTRVLSRANGSPTARVILVGEAPGRFGAERTGVPFHGDASGRRLERLIDAAGWTREDLFITNAVLCNPRDARGNNRPPAPNEVRACNTWLARQIEVVNPLLVVALGAVALRALAFVAPHDRVFRDAGSTPVAWHDRWLAAAMHPSARAAIHRADALQLEDFRRLGDWYRRLSAGSGACP